MKYEIDTLLIVHQQNLLILYQLFHTLIKHRFNQIGYHEAHILSLIIVTVPAIY